MEASRERLDLPNGELSLPRQHEADAGLRTDFRDVALRQTVGFKEVTQDFRASCARQCTVSTFVSLDEVDQDIELVRFSGAGLGTH